MSELIGAELDLAVLLALGRNKARIVDGRVGWNFPMTIWESPSTNWSQGGPIIERERISIDAIDGHWTAYKYDGFACERGPTPLIAAMRAFCVSRERA